MTRPYVDYYPLHCSPWTPFTKPEKPVKKIAITEKLAAKVLDIVDCGLVNSLDDDTRGKDGRPEPGHMCVEAAVCYALGEPHGDKPSCVDLKLRDFKIELNDREEWGSDKARARGLRELAVAQLGTKTGFDFYDFLERVKEALLYKELRRKLLNIDERNTYLVDELDRRKPGTTVVNILDYWSEYTSVNDAEMENWKFMDGAISVLDYAGLDVSSPNLRKVADAAVAALAAMKTPGSKFLHLARTKAPAKKAAAKKRVPAGAGK